MYYYDAQVARPMYNQIQNSDYRSYNRYAYSPEQRINDGFEITTNSWSKDQYEASVKKNFKYTDKTYGQALNAAAREGKPVVLVFGSQNTYDTQKLLDVKLPYTQANRDKAIFCYIDTDRVKENPNSEMARFVDRNVRPGNNVYTMVFSCSPGRNGEPIPDTPLMSWFGAGNYTANSINRNIAFGESNMRARKGKFRVPDESAEPKDTAEPVTDRAQLAMAERVKRNEALYSEMWNKSIEGGKQTDWRQGQKLFKEATKAADSIDQTAVKFEQKRVSDELAAAVKAKDEPKVKELQQKQLELARMADGRSGVRAARGFACMRWGYKDVGAQWLHVAMDINPNMSNTPRFHQQLEANLSPEEINAFAQQRADRGFALLSQGKKQAGMNGLLTAIDLNPELPKDKNFTDKLNKSLTEQERLALSEEVKRRFLDSIDPRGPQRRVKPTPPEVPVETPPKKKPADATETNPPVEKVEPAKTQFSSDEWDAALAESKRTGKPILLEFTGRNWCKYCISLHRQLGENRLEKEFKDKAIVVTIDPVNLDGSDSKSGTDLSLKFKVMGRTERDDAYGFPTYMVASLVDKGNGVIDVEPLKRWNYNDRIKDNGAALINFVNRELPNAERTMEQRGFRKPKGKKAA